MIYQIKRPLRQFAAIAILLACIGFVGLFAVAPVYDRTVELRNEVEQDRDVLGRLVSLSEDRETIDKLDQQIDAFKDSGIFISGESEPIRVAALQSQLAEIFAANGVKPRSTRGLPGRERNDLHLVGAQLQLVAPIDKLQKILLDIEAHKPVFLIDYLQIMPSAMTGVPNVEEAGYLDARFDVYAVQAPKGE